MNRRQALAIGLGAAASTLARSGKSVAHASPAASSEKPLTRDGARTQFAGIAIFAITPMRLQNGRAEVDFDGFARNLRFFVKHPSGYSLAVCGAVGEYHVLTPEERTRLVTIAAAEKGSRLLVAGAGGDTTREAIANAEIRAKSRRRCRRHPALRRDRQGR